MYGQRADARAVVHLHSTHSVAVSLLADVDPKDALPPLTAYFVMRVGRLPLAPYFPPGDETLARAVEALAGEHHAVLLANHGPVVAGTSLENAQYATEELEETAKLFLMLRGETDQAAHSSPGRGPARAVQSAVGRQSRQAPQPLRAESGPSPITTQWQECARSGHSRRRKQV